MSLSFSGMSLAKADGRSVRHRVSKPVSTSDVQSRHFETTTEETDSSSHVGSVSQYVDGKADTQVALDKARRIVIPLPEDGKSSTLDATSFPQTTPCTTESNSDSTSNGKHSSESINGTQESRTIENQTKATTTVSLNVKPKDTLSLEQRAAAELLEELAADSGSTKSRTRRGENSSRVISQTCESVATDTTTSSSASLWTKERTQQDLIRKGDASLKAKLFAHSKRAIDDPRGPLLLRNRTVNTNASGAANARDEAAYRQDLGRLPQELDSTEEAYSSIPIDEFGAAMLRGMGATEEQINGEGYQPYLIAGGYGRRGLGAESNALEAYEREQRLQNKKYLRPGQSRQVQQPAGTASTSAAELAAAAANHLKSSQRRGKWAQLKPDAIVRIQNNILKGEIALVHRTENVPGLNQIEVRAFPPPFDVESSEKSQIYVVKRDDCLVLNETDIKQDKITELIVKKLQAESKKILSDELSAKRRLVEQREAEARKRSEQDTKELEKYKPRDQRKKERSSNEQNVSPSEHNRSTRVPSHPQKRRRMQAEPVHPRDNWLREGICVRVANEAWKDGKYFKMKGIVYRVTAPGICTLLFPNRNNRAVREVSQHWLQTVVPRHEGELMLILRGEHTGARGRYLQRDKKRGTVTIQIQGSVADNEIVSLSVDDVSAYEGRR